MRRAGWWLVGLVGLSCSASEGTREGRTRLVIDTDLPTPEVASRLRIDVFRPDGTWFASRELDTSRPSAFPASFDVAAPEEGEVAVRVRLRISPDGYTRSYRGERFGDWPAVLGEPPAGEVGAGPRLVVDGQDQTPEKEPLPAVTVDRLVTVVARAGEVREAGVVLRGACAGTMADMAAGTTCVAAGREREPVAEAAEAVDASQTDAMREPCDGVAVEPGRVCVPGGVFVLGDRGQTKPTEGEGEFILDGRPERLVRVRRFMMDEDEVTVGRYRALEAAGLKTSEYSPVDNDQALSDDPVSASSCTYTTEAGDREQHPLNCLPWTTFREVCQRDGGDLPTEVQWEYAAALAGGAAERRYPWGDDEPTCDRAVYARVGSKQDKYCPESPALVSVEAAANERDRTPLGLRAMGGSMAEFVLDRPADYVDKAWTDAGFEEPGTPPLRAPDEEVADEDRYMLRGGSWASPANTLLSAFRQRGPGATPFFGARCAYRSP